MYIMGRKISHYLAYSHPNLTFPRLFTQENPSSCRRLRSFRDCGCTFAANAESGPTDVHPP